MKCIAWNPIYTYKKQNHKLLLSQLYGRNNNSPTKVAHHSVPKIDYVSSCNLDSQNRRFIA